MYCACDTTFIDLASIVSLSAVSQSIMGRIMNSEYLQDKFSTYYYMI